MNSIEISNLSHEFASNSKTLKDLSFNVPKGSIFGFLGKNGAGKTTTLKLILGLLKSQKGRILIFGKNIKSERIEILRRAGSLIESPSFYGHLSAEQNLLLLQKIYKCRKERISEVLTLVGLKDCGSKKVNQFSLGMKQRLAIGMALINEPELLVLDEPTNGLDPKGIIEIRELLLKLNADLGVTILISSHLLSEIDRLVTDLAIINKGELLFQGKPKELKAKSNNIVVVETNKADRVLKIATAKGLKCRIENSINFISNLKRDSIPEFVKEIVNDGTLIYSVKEQEVSLESLFINITKD